MLHPPTSNSNVRASVLPSIVSVLGDLKFSCTMFKFLARVRFVFLIYLRKNIGNFNILQSLVKRRLGVAETFCNQFILHWIKTGNRNRRCFSNYLPGLLINPCIEIPLTTGITGCV